MGSGSSGGGGRGEGRGGGRGGNQGEARPDYQRQETLDVQGAGQGDRWEEQADSGYWEQSCEAGEEKANRQYARCSSLDVEIKLLDQKLQRNIEF